VWLSPVCYSDNTLPFCESGIVVSLVKDEKFNKVKGLNIIFFVVITSWRVICAQIKH
jgi:hypothetical protein